MKNIKIDLIILLSYPGKIIGELLTSILYKFTNLKSLISGKFYIILEESLKNKINGN